MRYNKVTFYLLTYTYRAGVKYGLLTVYVVLEVRLNLVV